MPMRTATGVRKKGSSSRSRRSAQSAQQLYGFNRKRGESNVQLLCFACTTNASGTASRCN